MLCKRTGHVERRVTCGARAAAAVPRESQHGPPEMRGSQPPGDAGSGPGQAQPPSVSAEASALPQQRQTILLRAGPAPDLPRFFLSNFLSRNMNLVLLGLKSFGDFSHSSGHITNPSSTHRSVLNLRLGTPPRLRLQRLLPRSSWLAVSNQHPRCFQTVPLGASLRCPDAFSPLFLGS